MNATVAISFVACTVLVAVISWYKTRSVNLRSVSGLFLAGKNNNYLVVAGSLLLTNLSANQFIGENESVYVNNLSVMAWGVTSVVAMLLVSEFLLPVYFKGGMVTTPDFLADRYDEGTKRLVSIIFLLSYMVNLLPPVLYGGAVAMTGMFDLPTWFGVSYWQCIWIMVWILGLVGSIYTIVGGLKAITISDTVLGGGLLIIGICLPWFALKTLGNGNIVGGLTALLTKHTTHLNAIGSATDAVPFSTLFTGMLLVNIYYWGMEQYIVQQVLVAKNLAHAQKGMAFAAVGKLVTPVLINLPGLIAVHLYPSIENTASVFSVLAAHVLPSVLLGLTAALVFGAAMTTYNAGLHGSSTLFVLNIYKPYQAKRSHVTTDGELVRVGKRFEIAVSLLAMFTAPFILFAHSGFYTYLQKVSGLFSIPIFTIVVIGFLTKRVPPSAAKAGLLFFMVSYFTCQYVLDISLHFLHVLAILFGATSLLMLAIGRRWPMQRHQTAEFVPDVVGLAPWKRRHWASLLLILAMLSLYVVFSKWGVAT
ncbi:solute:sodium symporter family transporter [Parapedobacter koreensis]|uniref:Solute:Na+ symporter, SSS family n=1 Tax=Parapedobacter koreensis TaxID=332977 RepID=A0A1H7SKK3_9SPHI|nr:solute:sodium symporter family transporter [Parapedobacter koreensis]SEL72988.1 solute:Na+ symporter, SSS family [Parapedobacter koreensis]